MVLVSQSHTFERRFQEQNKYDDKNWFYDAKDKSKVQHFKVEFFKTRIKTSERSRKLIAKTT